MQEANYEHYKYFAGTDQIQLMGDTDAGRTIGITVDWETIQKIVEWGMKTKNQSHRAHMFWHMENPDAEMPCEVCDRGADDEMYDPKHHK